MNMVSSIDGRVTDGDGRSGGLGGDGDWEVYRALRALADGVLVGAGTARTEGYGPHRLTAELAALRRDDGRPGPAAIIVVSRSLDLDPSTRLFAEAKTPTIVVTCKASMARIDDALAEAAQIVVAGDDEVDLADGLRQLDERFGISRIVCEGGPVLNTAMLAAGLVDELCITIAPLVTGGDGPGIVAPPAVATGLDLRSVCEQDGEMYIRYGVTAHGH
ncbi:pyrimidine reductase family protein [soil metagenome]